MSSESLLDPCTVQSDPDPDITGWGVVASFVVSVSVTVLTIMVGYLKAKLPKDRYNQVDLAFLSKIPGCRRRFRARCVEAQAASSDFSGPPSLKRSMTTRIRQRKIRVYESFIMAVSDQQLVTGLALVISTDVIFCTSSLREKWSIYSYQTAVASAFFAALTHLSCVTVLRDNLSQHTKLRWIRLGIMTFVLINLAFHLIVGQADSFQRDSSFTLACAWHQFRLIPVRKSGRVILTRFLNQVIMVGMLGYGFIRRATELHLRARATERARLTPKMSATELGEGISRYMDAVDLITDFEGKKPKRMATISRHLVILHMELWDSFLWQIIWLAFYWTFGFAQVLFYLLKNKFRKDEASFGQFMAVFLLALPILAGCEAQTDAKHDPDSNDEKWQAQKVGCGHQSPVHAKSESNVRVQQAPQNDSRCSSPLLAQDLSPGIVSQPVNSGVRAQILNHRCLVYTEDHMAEIGLQLDLYLQLKETSKTRVSTALLVLGLLYFVVLEIWAIVISRVYDLIPDTIPLTGWFSCLISISVVLIMFIIWIWITVATWRLSHKRALHENLGSIMFQLKQASFKRGSGVA